MLEYQWRNYLQKNKNRLCVKADGYQFIVFFFQEPYNEMMKLKEKGMTMIAFFGEFAKESVVVRCNEIKYLLSDFEQKLDARKHLLKISLDVFTCLDQVC